jgi:hypothetical protein
MSTVINWLKNHFTTIPGSVHTPYDWDAFPENHVHEDEDIRIALRQAWYEHPELRGDPEGDGQPNWDKLYEIAEAKVEDAGYDVDPEEV